MCVTGKSEFHARGLLPLAVEAFRRQTYPAHLRELLIVADGHYDPVQDTVARVSGPDRIRLACTEHAVLGELRNLGTDMAREAGATLVMQWDDDDWHGEQRIARQVAHWHRLREGKGWDRPVALWRQIRCSLTTDTAYVYQPWLPVVGTILYRADTEARYPAKRRSEDLDFARQAAGSWDALQRAALDNDPADYVRFEHGHNTWSLDHIMRAYNASWARGQWHLGDRHREMLAEVIDPYLLAMARERSDGASTRSA